MSDRDTVEEQQDEKIDPEDLKCEHCGENLGAESIDDYEIKLAQHVLYEHKDVASPSAIRHARRTARGDSLVPRYR